MSAEKVVNELSNQIMLDLNQLATEQRYPGANSDASDDKIAELTKRIIAMRKMREEYENIQSGVIVYQGATTHGKLTKI